MFYNFIKKIDFALKILQIVIFFNFNKNEKRPFDILEYDLNASIEYGKITATLEKSGKVIGGLNMMIAAHALSNKMTLVTNNTKEFERVENLILDNWV